MPKLNSTTFINLNNPITTKANTTKSKTRGILTKKNPKKPKNKKKIIKSYLVNIKLKQTILIKTKQKRKYEC
jgi:hypothetical protein